MKYIKTFFILIAIMALAGGIYFYFQDAKVEPKIAQVPSEIKTVQVGDIIFNVELALTPAQREQGLSGHKPLQDNEGMLFVFDEPGTYNFWMKDMLFPIDIIWIAPTPSQSPPQAGGEGPLQIIHIEHDLSPDTYPKAFGPKDPALYVFEINAGLSKKNNFKVGDQVKFLK